MTEPTILIALADKREEFLKRYIPKSGAFCSTDFFYSEINERHEALQLWWDHETRLFKLNHVYLDKDNNLHVTKTERELNIAAALKKAFDFEAARAEEGTERSAQQPYNQSKFYFRTFAHMEGFVFDREGNIKPYENGMMPQAGVYPAEEVAFAQQQVNPPFRELDTGALSGRIANLFNARLFVAPESKHVDSSRLQLSAVQDIVTDIRQRVAELRYALDRFQGTGGYHRSFDSENIENLSQRLYNEWRYVKTLQQKMKSATFHDDVKMELDALIKYLDMTACILQAGGLARYVKGGDLSVRTDKLYKRYNSDGYWYLTESKTKSFIRKYIGDFKSAARTLRVDKQTIDDIEKTINGGTIPVVALRTMEESLSRLETWLAEQKREISKPRERVAPL